MTKEADYTDKSYVQQWPHARFFAAVPIKCFSGYVIGFYCVVDDRPRETPSEESIAYMHDVSGAIMEHLEAIKTRNLHTRSERLIKGLGLFVEGRSSLREWWLGESDNLSKSKILSADEKRRDLVQRADEEFGAPPRPDSVSQMTREMLAKRQGTSGDGQRESTDADDTTTQDSTTQDTNTSRSLFSDPDSSVPPTTPTPTPSFKRDSSKDLARSEAGFKGSAAEEALYPGTSASDAGREALSRRQTNKSNIMDEVESNTEASIGEKQWALLSRASNLIREAVELEGVVFLDASWSDPGTAGRHGLFESDGHLETSDSSFASTSSHSDQGNSGDTAQRRGSMFPGQSNGREASNKETCQVLGYSTRVKSGYAGNAVSSTTPTTDQKRLRRFLTRYPVGTIFTFDQHGVITSSDEDAEIVKASNHKYYQVSRDDRKRKTARQRDGDALQKMLPGARSVAFFPLWDFRKERWFAGTIAWTTDETRVFETDQLTYLAAFGNSIMAEVTRLEALAADRAKSNFISSISHELRSPLHGILGSAELLEDTETTPGQKDIVRMIEICGRTLLDTTEHL
jgi:hypothetical protein